MPGPAWGRGAGLPSTSPEGELQSARRITPELPEQAYEKRLKQDTGSLWRPGRPPFAWPQQAGFSRVARALVSPDSSSLLAASLCAEAASARHGRQPRSWPRSRADLPTGATASFTFAMSTLVNDIVLGSSAAGPAGGVPGGGLLLRRRRPGGDGAQRLTVRRKRLVLCHNVNRLYADEGKVGCN